MAPSRVGFVYDSRYLQHETGDHIESPNRLRAIMSMMQSSGLRNRLVPFHPRPATVAEISRVHSPEHVAQVREATAEGGGWLDADTVVSRASYDVALLAAGGVMVAAEAVMHGKANSVFALVRPPGHHATRARAMGFCLFNNIAVAAQDLLAKGTCGRILVVDFDAHHGNGTQEAFYADPRVLFFSVHQSPLYPGSGRTDETGAGQGSGFTVNAPVPPGCGDEEYAAIFHEILVPVASRFRPELIMVSAGYDAHWADPIATQQVTVSGFSNLVRILTRLAGEHCAGRMVFTLEGGYHPEALAACVRAAFDTLLGAATVDDPLGQPPGSHRPRDISELLAALKRIHRIS